MTMEGKQGEQSGYKEDLKGLYLLAVYIDQSIHALVPSLVLPLLDHLLQRLAGRTWATAGLFLPFPTLPPSALELVPGR